MAHSLLTFVLFLAATQVPQAPFVATPPDVVDRMLTLAGVTGNDVVYDLGSGDGRIVIAAAQKFGARGVGVDIDPVRVAEARRNAALAQVDHLVTFRVEDALATDVSEATVVTLYLLASQNVALKPALMRHLRPGARVVSHNFAMGDWAPDVVDTFTSADRQTRTLYLWRVSPASSPVR
jgi:ribosomal protein L11 methylase PrmA